MRNIKALMLVIGLSLFANAVRAEITDEEAYGMMAVCAASQGLIAVKMDADSAFADIIFAEAKWWKKLLAEFTSDDVAHLLVMTAAKEIQRMYNSGEVSWDELVETGQACSTSKSELGG